MRNAGDPSGISTGPQMALTLRADAVGGRAQASSRQTTPRMIEVFLTVVPTAGLGKVALTRWSGAALLSYLRSGASTWWQPKRLARIARHLLEALVARVEPRRSTVGLAGLSQVASSNRQVSKQAPGHEIVGLAPRGLE